MDLSRLSQRGGAVVEEPEGPAPAGPLASLAGYLQRRTAEAGRMTQGPFHAPGGIDQAAGGSIGLVQAIRGPSPSAKLVTVMQGGRRYEIPEMWLMARLRTLGGNPKEAYPKAISEWVAQEEMARSLGH